MGALVDVNVLVARAWRALTAALPKGRAAETDCYLAAFAIAGSHSLVSFDRGLRRFTGLDLTNPN